jgi:hypothetical protein
MIDMWYWGTVCYMIGGLNVIGGLLIIAVRLTSTVEPTGNLEPWMYHPAAGLIPVALGALIIAIGLYLEDKNR